MLNRLSENKQKARGLALELRENCVTEKKKRGRGRTRPLAFVCCATGNGFF